MKVYNNLISGTFAALGGALTKVGFSFGSDGPIDVHFMPVVEGLDLPIPKEYLFLVKYLLHLAFILVALTSSGLMYTYYIKSMHENGAAKATVYNFAVNYIGSVVFGAALFGEEITGRLLLGLTLILGGTSLISQCDEGDKSKKD